ncbi:MAG: 50S ribosomal protein L23 [Capsulimonadaceae bacterium]
MSSTTKSPYDIIMRPIVTEKSVAAGREHNTYTFVVAKEANKYEIAAAIEFIQSEARNPVNVVTVNTLIVKGKTRRGRYMKRANRGRSSDWKKAFITLRPGQQIEVVEGV